MRERRISAYEMALSATVVVLIIGSLMQQVEMGPVEQQVEIVLDTIQAAPPPCEATHSWPMPREGWTLYAVICPEGRLPLEEGDE